MTHRVRLVSCTFAALLLAWTGVSEAFWPFTRGVKAVPDSLQAQDWGERFQKWNLQTSASSIAAAAAAVSDSSRTVAPAKTDMAALIQQAQQMARDDSLAKAAAAQASTWADSLDTDAALEAMKKAQEAETQAKIVAAQTAAGFKPRFESSLTSNNDRMSLDSSLNASFLDPSGVSLSSGLNYRDEYNLNQGTNTRSKGLVNTFALPFPSRGLRFELRTGNSKRDVLGSRTTTNERATTVTDNRNAGLTSSIGRRLIRGVSANAGYRVDFRYGNQDIIATGSSSGDRENKTQGQAFGAGVNIDRLKWLQMQARVGRALDDNSDITSSFITPDNPTGEQTSSSRGDSVEASVKMPLGRILPETSANYRLTRAKRSFTDPARTSSGATGGGGSFILETEQSFRRSLQLNSKFKPFSRLEMDLSFEVARDSVGYEVRANSFSDTKRQRWNAKGTFQYHRAGTIGFTLDHGRTTVDRDEAGAPNPQTRTDRENRLTANMVQTWVGTLKTKLYGEVTLNQGFYIHAGPQGLADRDDFRTQLGLDVDGKINTKMTAGFKAYVRTFNQAFIDPRRSASSRDETEFVTRLDFSYQITPSFRVKQLYGLSSKVLDEIYNPDRNTLNRNHFLQTNWAYTYNSRLSFAGLFNYILQDTGASLDDPRTRSPERFFAPTQENRKNEAKVDVSYALLPGGALSINSSQQVVRDRRTSFNRGNISSVSTTLRSNLGLGVASTITLGDLKLVSHATRNQNINSAINRNVFYVIDATLSYVF